MTAPFLVDSYAPITPEAVAHLLGVTGGRRPAAWGRYIYQDLTRDFDVAAANDFPIMLISPRSERVPFGGAGAPNGADDRDRCERLVELATSRGARVLRSVWLDVEMNPTMHADYWRGWARAFEGSALLPCVYMPNRNYWPASWEALEAAVATGARCGGTWVALYRQPSDGSAVFRDEPWEHRPKASEHVPYLAWQSTGNAYKSRYDFSTINPDADTWVRDTLGPQVTREVAPGAVSVVGLLQLDAVADQARAYEAVP